MEPSEKEHIKVKMIPNSTELGNQNNIRDEVPHLWFPLRMNLKIHLM